MELLQRSAIGLVPFRNLLANRIVIPRKTFEYMAAGVPVVASNLDAMREIIEHKKTGLLVTPENPYELADSILDLLSSQELYENIQSNARTRIINHNCDVQTNIEKVFR